MQQLHGTLVSADDQGASRGKSGRRGSARPGQGEQGVLSWIVGFAGQPQALAAADLLVGGGDLAAGAEPGPALMAGGRGQGETVDPGHPGDPVGDVGAADVQPHPGEQPVLRRGELHRVDPGDREQRDRLAHPPIMASGVRQGSWIKLTQATIAALA